MNRAVIKKSVEVHAPREKVWDVLLEDEFTRVWYAAFSPGTYAETDWKVGGKAVFRDDSGSGLVSKVMANERFELISVEHQGVIMNGTEDFESAEARQWKGCRETYRLSEKNGVTTLAIENEMPEEFRETFLASWDTALQKIKELAEGGK
jgi:uncharacterized protein YndB with AHSA1/START domain